MAREYFCAYHSMLDQTKRLSDSELGRLFRALLRFSSEGIVSDDLKPKEAIAFDILSEQIMRDIATYNERCKTNSTNGSKGGRPRRKKAEQSQQNKGSDDEKTEESERFSEKAKKANGSKKSQEEEEEEEYIYTHSKECVNAGAREDTHAREAEAVLSVSRESEILGGCSLSEAVRERMEMWILYKGEGFYTLTSFGALLSVVKQYEDTYGAEAVAGIISQSISNTWKNICFDRLDERASAANTGGSFDTDEFFDAALKNTYG